MVLEETDITGPASDQDTPVIAASNEVSQGPVIADPPVLDDEAGITAPTVEDTVLHTVSREEKIAKLLAQGQQSLKQFRLLTPKDRSAYHYFNEVIVLDPGNTEALDGLDRIVEQYVALVRRANKRQATRLAEVYISRGLKVKPGNRTLLAMRESMREPPVTPQETIVKAPPPVAEPEPPAENFFSRLKALFTSSPGGKAEVVERSVTSIDP
jgi:hypothetical protein